MDKKIVLYSRLVHYVAGHNEVLLQSWHAEVVGKRDDGANRGEQDPRKSRQAGEVAGGLYHSGHLSDKPGG